MPSYFTSSSFGFGVCCITDGLMLGMAFFDSFSLICEALLVTNNEDLGKYMLLFSLAWAATSTDGDDDV